MNKLTVRIMNTSTLTIRNDDNVKIYCNVTNSTKNRLGRFIIYHRDNDNYRINANYNSAGLSITIERKA